MEKKTKIKVGIIGLGRLGYRHALSIMRCNSAQLIALADPDTQKLEIAVKEFEPSYSFIDYRAMLDIDIEAVIVAAPTKFHYEILLELVQREKSVFVEKPITFTLEEAEEISKLCNKKNAYLQVGFMRRFDPGYIAAKELIDSKKFGEPIYIHSLNRDPSGPPKDFIPDSGGLFVDMGIHDLDSACWLMGSDIVEIYAQGGVFKHAYVGEMGDIDEGQMLLKFANGKLGTIEVSRNANGIMDVRTEVVGTRESVYIGQTQTTPITRVNEKGLFQNMAPSCLERFDRAYELEITEFIKNVKNGCASPVDAVDGLKGLKLALAAKQSLHSKAAIQQF